MKNYRSFPEHQQGTHGNQGDSKPKEGMWTLLYFDTDDRDSIKKRTDQNRLNETVNNNFNLKNVTKLR